MKGGIRKRETAARPAALLAAVVIIGVAILSSVARAEDDLSAYRDQFRSGLEQFKAGNTKDAIATWEAIYREVGKSKGYRIAFDLARAYQTLKDANLAAEYYEAFVAEVDARRAAGQTLEPLVAKEENDARAELGNLIADYGRIRIRGQEGESSVQVDSGEPRPPGFIVYVVPGTHHVVFDPGLPSAQTRDVAVRAGEIVDLAPHVLAQADSVQMQKELPHNMTPALVFAPSRRETLSKERPFSPAVLFVAGGVSLVSVALPIIVYSSALSFRDANKLSPNSSSVGGDADLQSQYDSRRTSAYLSLLLPISLAAITGGLTAYYFLGTRERATLIPMAAPVSHGVVGGVTARF